MSKQPEIKEGEVWFCTHPVMGGNILQRKEEKWAFYPGGHATHFTGFIKPVFKVYLEDDVKALHSEIESLKRMEGFVLPNRDGDTLDFNIEDGVCIVDTKEIEARSVMYFANSLIGAYETGFIENHESNLADVYSAAQSHVAINYAYTTKSLVEDWGEDVAQWCRTGCPHDNNRNEVTKESE